MAVTIISMGTLLAVKGIIGLAEVMESLFSISYYSLGKKKRKKSLKTMSKRLLVTHCNCVSEVL